MADQEQDDFTPVGQSAKSGAPVSATSKPLALSGPDDDFVPLSATPGLKQPFNMFPKGPGQPLTDESVGRVLNYIRPYISGGTSLLASPFGPAASMAAYALPDAFMKAINPASDLRSQDPKEAFGGSVKDALINEVGGRLLSGVFKVGSALRNAGQPDPTSILKLYPTTAQALENYGFHKLAKVAGFSEDLGAPAAKAAALDRAGGEGFTQALLLSNRMNSGGRFTKNVFQDIGKLRDKITGTLEQGIGKNAVPGQFQTPTHYASQEAYDLMKTGSPFESIDNVMNDSNKLDKVLALGQTVGPKSLNVRKDLQAYYFNRIFDEATTMQPKGGARIDPAKIQEMWFNPKNGELAKNLDTLYGTQGRKDLNKFMTNIMDAQSGNPRLGAANAIKYYGKGFGIGSLLTPFLGSAAPVVGSALYLTNGTMGRLLTNPSVGKAVIDMAQGLKGGPGNNLLARGIFSALEGSRVALMDNNQKKTWGSIQKQPDGSYQFVQE